MAAKATSPVQHVCACPSAPLIPSSSWLRMLFLQSSDN
jgi:hypothetical protein